MQVAKSMFFAITFFILVPAFAGDADNLAQQGFDALSTGNYNEAAEFFLAALESDENNIEANRGIIIVYLTVGDYTQAAENATSMSTRGKATPEILALGADALALTGSHEKALELYRKGIGLDNSHIHSLLGAARIESLAGNRKESEELLEKARAGNASIGPVEMVYAAAALVELNRYAEANTLLGQAIEKDPLNTDALNMRASLFLKKYDYPYAKKLFERSLEINPKHPDTLTGLAWVYEQIPKLGFERFSDAYSLVRKALRTNRSHAGAYKYLAHTGLSVSNYEQAIKYLDKALETNKRDSESLAMLAATYLLKGDTEQYDKLKKEAFKQKGSKPAFLHGVADILQSKFRYQEALDLSLAALKEDEHYWPAYSTAGLNMLRLGREEEAKPYLKKSQENDPFNIWTYNSLQLLMHINDNFKEEKFKHFVVKLHKAEFDTLAPYIAKEAENSYKALAAKYKIELDKPVIVEMFRKHDFFSARTVGLPGISAAGACFGNLVTMDSPSARRFGTYNWARTLHHELTHVFTLTRSRNRISRWFGEGCSTYEERCAKPYWRRNMERVFIDSLERGALIRISKMEKEFNRPRGMESVMLAYYQSSLIVEYITEKYGFDKILAIIDGYGKSRDENDIMSEALGVDLNKLDAGFKEWAADKFLKFKVEGRITNMDVSRLQDQVEFNPDDARLHARLARSYVAAKKLLDAENSITCAMKLEPSNPENFLAQAELDMQQGFASSAKKNYLKALSNGLKNTYDVHLVLARIYFAEEKKEEAIEYLKKASVDFPLDISPASPYRQLYAIYTQDERKDEALEQLEKIVALTDMEPMARVTLADKWFEDGRFAEAIDLLRQLLHLNPLTPGIHERLGDALYADEMLEEALEEFKTAVIIGGQGQAKAYSGLARCYFDLEDNKEAEENARKALQLDPGNSRAKEVLELLGKWSD